MKIIQFLFYKIAGATLQTKRAIANTYQAYA